MSEEEINDYEIDAYERVQEAVEQANYYFEKHAEELYNKFPKYEVLEELIDDIIIYERMDFIDIDTGYYDGFSVYVQDNYSGEFGSFDDMELKLIENGVPEVIAQQFIGSLKEKIFSEVMDILKDFRYLNLKILNPGNLSFGRDELLEKVEESEEELLFSDEGFITLAHVPEEEGTNIVRAYDSIAEEVEDMNDFIGIDIKEIAEKYEEKMPKVSEVLKEIYLNNFEDPSVDEYFQCYVIDYSSSGKMFSVAVADIEPVFEETTSRLEGLGIPEVVVEQIVGLIEKEIKDRMKNLLEKNEDILFVVEPEDRTSNFSTIKSKRTTI